MNDFTCLAISGSLRASSSNTRVLQAAAQLAPPDMRIAFYAGLAELPYFNPDLDVDPAPTAVVALRLALRQSQALIISSPEYAHGVPGSLKNALDWLVSGVELSNMPVALISTSPYATHATAALTETLHTMGARVILPASMALPLAVRAMSVEAIVGDAAMAGALRQALTALREA